MKIGEKPPFWEAGRARSEPSSPYDEFPSVSAAAAPFWGGGFFEHAPYASARISLTYTILSPFVARKSTRTPFTVAGANLCARSFW